MKTRYFILLVVLGALILSGCAEPEHINDCVSGEPAGFWSGLWHGMIAVIAFICKLFGANVAIYAVNNTGGWYDFGFLLGVGAFVRSESSVTKKHTA
jgi:hypothetical protein